MKPPEVFTVGTAQELLASGILRLRFVERRRLQVTEAQNVGPWFSGTPPWAQPRQLCCSQPGGAGTSRPEEGLL